MPQQSHFDKHTLSLEQFLSSCSCFYLHWSVLLSKEKEKQNKNEEQPGIRTQKKNHSETQWVVQSEHQLFQPTEKHHLMLKWLVLI